MKRMSSATSGSPVQVIINADDLGISAEVNQAMLDWAGEGVVTSVSAMGAAPAQDAVAARDLEAMGVTVGVHCNLSEFVPLTSEEALAPLLRDDGTFDTVVRSVHVTAGLRQAVETELLAQIDAVRDHGVTVSHLDSHHHDHHTPWMMRVFRNLRRTTGIKRTRGPLSNSEIGGARQQFLRARARDAQRHLFGFRTPNQFVDLAYLGRNGIDELKKYRGVVEVMTHPGEAADGEWEAGLALRDASWVRLVNHRAV